MKKGVKKVVPRKETRDLIMAAATKLFAKKGYESVTTRDIAKAAQVNNASLYYYFKNKENLLYEILNESITKGLGLINDIENSERTSREKLLSIMLLHTRAAIDLNSVKLLEHEYKWLTREHKDQLKKKQREYIGPVVQILNDLKDRGEIVGVDTKVLTFAFFGMVSWAYRWYDLKGTVTPNQLAEIFYRIFSLGVFTTDEHGQLCSRSGIT
jgi:AcrR family transcriptional regulator